ncbi:hypothetical protein [Mucilaginibacter aquaedulcis]|uniref:hypothetical protein n=1 Tax=Mucilaginibacter aquaedulcis TaxID=1187081 RepID=UPI0025B535B0|nr:hypothetical protein [Mucilaginibacter aquaedulcis]MDN3551458.1 hypothetical protein [Mucilaginibacter aquaedulcis]
MADPQKDIEDARRDIEEDNNHWDKLFKLCAYVIGAVIVYCFLITFIPIPLANVETARQVLIFFIGTLVGYCFNLLSPGITSKRTLPTQLNVKGDNTSITSGTTTRTDIGVQPADPGTADQ